MLGPASDPLQVAANEFCAGESKPASLLVEDAAGRETLWKLVRELVTSVAEPKKG